MNQGMTDDEVELASPKSISDLLAELLGDAQRCYSAMPNDAIKSCF